jgi:hypothetical protein
MEDGTRRGHCPGQPTCRLIEPKQIKLAPYGRGRRSPARRYRPCTPFSLSDIVTT